MNKGGFEMKRDLLNIIRNNASSVMLLFLLCLPSCWEGYNDVIGEQGSDSDAPAEVVMINSNLTSTSIQLKWTEPDESGFSHVIVSWTGTPAGSTTCHKGTTQCAISGSAGNEFTVTLKTVDLAGNESAGTVFAVTIPSSGSPVLRFIYNQSQLTSFNGNYSILMADITLTGTWTPSPLTDNGIVDGNGHVIRNVACSGAAPMGFFTYINSGSRVKNLGLENVNISGTGNNTGGIAGYNIGAITNCYVTGTITGQVYVGGLVGSNGSGSAGVISDSHASVNISETGAAQIHGGLVGYNTSGSTISNCYTSGSMTGSGNTKGGLVGRNSGTIEDSHSSVNISTNVFSAGSGADYGGLVGDNQSGSIKSCYATGNITGYSSTGGLIGINYVTVEKCYATGNITGTNRAGGIVGFNSGGAISICYTSGSVGSASEKGGIAGTQNSGSIKNCYSTATVNGSYSGGICGRIDGGTIENCYFSGALTNSSGGGIAGYIAGGTVTSSYHNGLVGFYDQLTNNGTYGTNITNINNMKIQATYSGWDFSTIWIISSSINNGFPYLTELVP
jgi:hypothetical protein